ncbi:6-phosphogluconate dehydrogenase C-terminal domain-like protein [Rhizodiscina lignyota]|uniref:6-phosphogluconate dehydrogenase C-terminal domain-like protein n=1 Tax=Rhizodiscina lignyota TaxID=1504668 RepID=A0A9P4I5C4_9PEZI|nr:6-phosphogluconate dehydrogenase C-terminal domain-like protein [Rhizodiscina lignyota]
MASKHLATIGILSIGDMGAGIARLLHAHNYKVITNVTGRSASTQSRASAASITLLPTDEDLVAQADYILSIVPPRDAIATATRIASAFKPQERQAAEPLYFLDLNAISPATARTIGALFKDHDDTKLRYVDGGIIGGPPKPPPASASSDANGTTPWTRPSIVLSGPHPLSAAPTSGSHLFSLLNARDVGPDIGSASGLKCCFASLTKGFTALAIQSYSTAARLGVLDELRGHLAGFAPKLKEQGEKGVVGMAPKAYRWVDEMREIGRTFREDGGWAEEWGDGIYDSIAGTYRFVADGTVLGEETIEKRKRGTLEDVVEALKEGLEETDKL